MVQISNDSELTENNKKKLTIENALTENEVAVLFGSTISSFITMYIVQIASMSEGFAPWFPLFASVLTFVILGQLLRVINILKLFNSFSVLVAFIIGVVAVPILMLLLDPALSHIISAIKYK